MRNEIHDLYEFGSCSVDPSKRLLTSDGEVIPLPPKTFDLLMLFLQSDGRLLGKQELITRLWPDTFVEEANLTFQIATLRKAIGKEAAEWIETVPKHGYRLTVSVRNVRNPPTPVDHPGTVEANAKVAADRTARRVPPRVRYAAVGILILLTAAVAVYWKPGKSHSPRAGNIARPRLAVLPLANLSPESDTEYFSDGLTEEIIHSLATNLDVEIVSRTSSFALNRKGRDLEEIGAKLKANVIVEGSVRRAGNRVRITVRLLQVSGDRELWSEDYDRLLTDVFEVQDEIARSVAKALSIRLAPHAAQGYKVSTSNVAAHDAYLRGRYFWSKRTPDSVEKSIVYFTRAIAEDPKFAFAYTGLADSYGVLGFNGIMPPKKAFSEAKSAAARALALDGNSAAAHTSLAYVEANYDWSPKAESDFRKAIELDPGYATAHDWYSAWLTSAGRFADAMRESERAQELEPLSLIVGLHAGWPYYYSRGYPEAIERFRKVLELEPGFGARSDLSLAYTAAGSLGEAVAEGEKAVAMSADPFTLAALVRALALAGRTKEATEVLVRLVQQAGNRYVSRYRLAMAYTAIGERDHAFAALKDAVLEREPLLLYLHIDPSFETLRSDPRYSALIESIRPIGK